MSKEAALRQMREARYAQRMARAGAPAVPARPASRPAGQSKVVPTAPASAAPSVDALCGHRSMNGRSCTREQGHTAKNHRYS